MPPIEITFHSRPPAAQHTKLQKGTKSLKAPGRTLYFTINHGKASASTPAEPIALGPAQSPPASVAKQLDTTVRPTGSTQSKRAKPKPVLPPTQSASLTPLLQPIVSRCLARPPTGITSWTSTPPSSPPFKKGLSKNPSPATSTSGHPHPYSRLSDTKNTRSSVPSPREVARAQQAELDKIRVREESAAAARAAAAAKRRRGKSRANSNKATPRGATSVSPTKDDVPTVTTEAPSKDSSPAPLPPRVGLKRTRSNGLGISVGTANIITGPVVGSPLRAVIGPFDSEDSDQGGPSRKRSRLAESTAAPGRRANSHSPHTDSKALLPPDQESRLLKTEPLAAAQLLPSTVTSNMRRASSSAGTGAPVSRKMSRTGSTGSVGSEGARERSKRETTLPGRLRDYDTGAVV